jgi:hypothetical protein
MAVVAVMRKLLIVAAHLIQTQEGYDASKVGVQSVGGPRGEGTPFSTPTSPDERRVTSLWTEFRGQGGHGVFAKVDPPSLSCFALDFFRARA